MSASNGARHRFLTGAALVILQGTIYGISDPLVKLLLREVPVFVFLPVRYFVSSLFLFLLFRKKIVSELRSARLRSYFLPAFFIALAYLLVNVALASTEATRVAFVRSLSVVITPVLMLIFYGKHIPGKNLLLYALMPVGLFLMCLRGAKFVLDPGCALAFAGAILVAASLMCGKQSLRYVSPVTLTFVQVLFSMLLNLAVCLLKGEFRLPALGFLLEPKLMLILLYAALGCTVGGYFLQNQSLRYLTPEYSGIFQCTYPIMTAIVARFLLRELLPAQSFVGMFLLLLCILGQSLLSLRAEERTQPA